MPRTVFSLKHVAQGVLEEPVDFKAGHFAKIRAAKLYVANILPVKGIKTVFQGFPVMMKGCVIENG